MTYRAILDDDSALPSHGSDRWALRTPGFTRYVEDRAAVRRTLRRWVPMQPLLIGAPDRVRFQLPTDVDDPVVVAAARNAARLHSLLMGVALFLGSLPLVMANVWHRLWGESMGLPLMLLGFAFLFVWDAQTRLSDVSMLRERAAFFYWLRVCSPARLGFVVFAAVMLAMGALQLAVVLTGEGLYGAFQAYGLLYQQVVQGELWRLATGAFLHYSMGHFLLNAALVCLLGALAWAYHDWGALLIFVLACMVSMTAQMLFGGQLHDNAGGVSGGAYALGGLVLGTAWVRADTLPPGLGLQLAGLLVLGIVGAEFGGDAATVAHVSGLLLGLVLGAAVGIGARPEARPAAAAG